MPENESSGWAVVGVGVVVVAEQKDLAPSDDERAADPAQLHEKQHEVVNVEVFALSADATPVLLFEQPEALQGAQSRCQKKHKLR